MKKTSLLACTLVLASQFASSQTLTKIYNEPAVGDIHTLIEYDSTSVVPRNTGTGQHWNFSSMTPEMNSVSSTTFIAASSVPSSSIAPGTTLAEDDGTGYYNFYKSSSSQFDLSGSWDGSSQPASGLTLSNTATEYAWPTAYGATLTDSFGGQGVNFAATTTGNATITASGTGTITLPGGQSYPNILQLKTIRVSIFTITSPVVSSFTSTSVQYDYFEPSQKFPLFTVNTEIDNDGSGQLDTSSTFTGNQLITVGIQDRNFDAQYAIYPNPAKDNFSVKLSNASNDKCTIEIYSATGQLVKTAALGNTSLIEEKISLSGLSTGMYIVKTSLGNKTSSRHLVIE
jgi:hypothetical protein